MAVGGGLDWRKKREPRFSCGARAPRQVSIHWQGQPAEFSRLEQAVTA